MFLRRRRGKEQTTRPAFFFCMSHIACSGLCCACTHRTIPDAGTSCHIRTTQQQWAETHVVIHTFVRPSKRHPIPRKTGYTIKGSPDCCSWCPTVCGICSMRLLQGAGKPYHRDNNVNIAPCTYIYQVCTAVTFLRRIWPWTLSADPPLPYSGAR